MASPGIRSFNHARVLQDALPDANVTLAFPESAQGDLDPATVDFRVVRFDASSLNALARGQDVIIGARFPLKMLPGSRARLVLDLYTPFFTEWMEMTKRDPGESHRRSWLDMKRRDLVLQMAMADLVLCSNGRQRDLLVGMMGTMGLMTPQDYLSDPTLDGMIKVAPLGMRAARPTPGEPLLRGARPGFGPDDFIMIWNGIIVEWYDLELLVRAVHRVAQTKPHVRLFFMGTEHPDSHGSKPLMGLGGGATRAAMALAEELGILDKHVFFNFTWASNEETQQYLLESDIGVCTYFDSLETRYSFRVRYLDLFWAALPIVCTRGDVIAEMVDRRTLGVTVPEGDLDGLTAAIDRLATDKRFRATCHKNLQTVRREYTWERTLAPLVEWCGSPPSGPVRRQARRSVVAARLADWLGSRAYYEGRYGLRRRIRQWREGITIGV
jgi:glycosyltransferase involved in cell wall biosynthesis